MSHPDLSQISMLDLFRMDAESQVQALTSGLLALERDPGAADQLESCMRAAHSLKGAARIVGIEAGVEVAHVLEDCFVAAQQGRCTLHRQRIDHLLRGVDLLNRIALTAQSELERWNEAEQTLEIQTLLAALSRAFAEADADADADATDMEPAAIRPETTLLQLPSPTSLGDTSAAAGARETQDRFLRVTAADLNRLLALASESRAASRWVQPFADSLQRLKRLQSDLTGALDQLRETLSDASAVQASQTALATARQRNLECGQFLAQRLVEIEIFDNRVTTLAHRLYEGVLACRMRPFADGVQSFPRMARDLAHSLGKQVRLEIVGPDTRVDREILEKLEASLGHLLRNAVDHGLESPGERQAAGKPVEGVVRLEARHSAGMLHVIVSDDGRGIDLAQLRHAVVQRNLTNAETAGRLSDAELLEFLFLPGFSMADTVTDISGRGVGLDAVQDMLKQVHGTAHVSAQHGGGTRFQLQLPLTLSVVRALLVEISGEPYAIPLAHVTRTLRLPKQRIDSLEGRQHFDLDGRRIGLVTAHQVLDTAQPGFNDAELSVVVLANEHHAYGLIVDRFIGERELVVQPLDRRLGKIKDIAAGGLMDDGSPVLIVDVDDCVRSVEKLIASGRLSGLESAAAAAPDVRRKRVLVVDDSLTVRELERKLLASSGYAVDVAIDGMDGWNAVRTGNFDLVITDVDMPRMDGIELVALIRKDPHLKSLPVMIVSYKDRPEDRRRGLEVGADHYLAKGSFNDDTLLQSVVDLIGTAVP
ncbi:hybrid sensor histidine kinase/response regulator [Povalibacter sp.]|uniref:hybrid sensor histidine kinase/response regulator n=1 Tax=Povalibacter sp. TaxID=1962978 RepID=UPI002F42415A